MTVVGTILVVLAVLGVFFSLVVGISFTSLTNEQKSGFVHLSFFAALAVLACGILVLAL